MWYGSGFDVKGSGKAVKTMLPIAELNERSREVLRLVVESWVHDGEPVGSRTVSRRLSVGLSPASIRSVMADLEDLGLLYAPHVSAGRLPTEHGLRMFVSGLLEVGRLSDDERSRIDSHCQSTGRSLEQMLSEATTALSGLSRCASLVLAPKTDSTLRHIEFVSLGPGRALVVMVTSDGLVENRLIEVPAGLPPSVLQQASNFLSVRLGGQTLADVRRLVSADLDSRRAELDELTARVVEAGLAIWGGDEDQGALIIRGQSNLLQDVHAIEDLERIRSLFETLEARQQMLRLVDLVQTGEGVQIFIGSDNDLFGAAGCSLIVAPYQNSREQIVGAIGVIGPTRLNYARIIPMVDYTARVIGQLIG